MGTTGQPHRLTSLTQDSHGAICGHFLRSPHSLPLSLSLCLSVSVSLSPNWSLNSRLGVHLSTQNPYTCMSNRHPETDISKNKSLDCHLPKPPPQKCQHHFLSSLSQNSKVYPGSLSFPPPPRPPTSCLPALPPLPQTHPLLSSPSAPG